jgi:hypothetical protein
MPTLPPGSPNNVNLTYTPTWLFTPSTSATNMVRLWNNGRNTARPRRFAERWIVADGERKAVSRSGFLPERDSGRAPEHRSEAG